MVGWTSRTWRSSSARRCSTATSATRSTPTGGLIFTLVDRVPDIGETVRHPVGLNFHILDADPRRIKRVRIEIVDPAERSPERLAGELIGPGD
ncbi:MAG: transporter associated domain-containing protein [Geminicoccaceae bacterium]